MKKLLKKIIPSKFIIFLREWKNYYIRIQVVKFENNVKVLNTKLTLKQIENTILTKQKGAYLRFGDGELMMIKNTGESRNQKFNIELAKELEEAISLNDQYVLKSLAIHSRKFGMDENMKPGIHERPNWEAERFLLGCYKYFIGNQIFSPVALHYQVIYNKDNAIKFLRILKSFNPIFVGSEQNNPEILNSLLGSEDFIKTLHRHTYSQIDKIELEIVNKLKERDKDFDVIIFSSGVSSKAIIKRLYLNYDKPIFLFDMGSVVDLFHGRMMWTWVKESGISKEYLESILKELN